MGCGEGAGDQPSDDSAHGREIMQRRFRPDHSVGVHVPKGIATEPAERPEALRDVDLFTEPGESRHF